MLTTARTTVKFPSPNRRFKKSIAVHIELFLIVSLISTMPAFAQRLRDLKPKTVPPQVEAPEGKLKPPEIKAPEDMDETVMVEALKGIIFIINQDQIKDQPPVPEDGLDVSRLPLFQKPEFTESMDIFLGKPVSMASLTRLRATLYLYYTRHDLPFVSITLPEQDITTGVVQILVIEGNPGEIKIEGARYFSEDLYLSMLRLKPGDPIRKSVIDEDVDWINQNPFRGVGMLVEPGKEPGITNLILRANEQFPLRVYAGHNNGGTDLTGKNRRVFGFNWGNALGLGHQFNYQFTGDSDFDKSLSHGGSYVIPLSWRHFLSLSGVTSKTESDLPAPLSATGRSSQLSLNYEAPLSNIGSYSHTLSGLFDFKKSDNNLEFGGIPVTDNETHILEFGAMYNGILPDSQGVTSFRSWVTYSPGDLSSRNKTEYFSISRAFAEAEYLYAKFYVSRNQRLPFNSSLILSGEIQFADGNLLGTEQLAFGGAATIRGYDEGEHYGDEGYILKQELRLPPIPMSRLFQGKDLNGFIQVYLFHDYGVSKNVDLLIGEDPSIILQSVGVGLQCSIGRYFNLTFDYGWQQKELAWEERSSRGHISITLSY
jgi:hemolysin activation/secretion protein